MAGVERERADVAKWLGLLMITLTVWQCVPRLSPSPPLSRPLPLSPSPALALAPSLALSLSRLAWPSAGVHPLHPHPQVSHQPQSIPRYVRLDAHDATLPSTPLARLHIHSAPSPRPSGSMLVMQHLTSLTNPDEP